MPTITSSGLLRFSAAAALAAAACASPDTRAPAAGSTPPVALQGLPATFRNAPSCAGCLELTLTLRPDGAYVVRERLASSEFYDFGGWRQPSGGGALELSGGRDAPRRYFVGSQNTLDAQEGTAGGDLQRAAELEALRGPFRMVGLFDGRLFKECQTGLAWPLDESRAAEVLKREYLQRDKNVLLVSVDGRFEPKGRREALRVVRTAAIHNERGCPG